MRDIIITEDLIAFIKANPHVEKLYFTANGDYHTNVYVREDDGEDELFAPGADHHVTAGSHGKIRKEYAIVAAKTREEILSAEYVDDQKPAEAAAAIETQETEGKGPLANTQLPLTPAVTPEPENTKLPGEDQASQTGV